MKYLDTNNTVQPLVNNHRPIQPQNDRLVLSFNSNPGTTSTHRTTMKPSTTGSSASKIYENHFMLLGSLFLILSTFLEM
jgi:hypothetical protein